MTEQTVTFKSHAEAHLPTSCNSRVKENKNESNSVYLDWNPELFFPASARKQALLGKFGSRRVALTTERFAYPQIPRTSHWASPCFKPSRGELHRCHMKSENPPGGTVMKETGSDTRLTLPFCPSQPRFPPPGSPREDTLTIKHLYRWEFWTTPQKNTENFKYTHLSRLLPGKVTWCFLTATVVYWSKL